MPSWTSLLSELFDISVLPHERLLKLTTPLGGHRLLVQRAVGNEQLSTPFTLTVDCLSQEHDLDLRALLAKPVTLSILLANGRYRDIHAIVSDAARLGSDGGISDYQLTLKPWMALLEHVNDSRIFQDLTAVEIVTQVLTHHAFTEGGFRFELRHQERYPKRSYCVQYRETDYHFISRLIEEEGIWWYVVQESDKHVIVFTDDNDTTSQASPYTIRYHRQDATESADSMTDWGYRQRVQPTRVSLSSFDYKAPSAPLRVSQDTVDAHGVPPLERYDYPGEYSYKDHDRGQRLSETQLEALESKVERFSGAGGMRHLSVGQGFVLIQHPNHDHGGAEQRTFLLIGQRWAAENNLPVSVMRREMPGSLEAQVSTLRTVAAQRMGVAVEPETSGTAFFHTQLDAQYHHVTYRAPVWHVKPEVGGPQTAIVVGPANESIHTDRLNRVRVQFHWDRQGRYTDASGCWLRVSQANADSGWGAVFVPRVGQEVIVDFLEGDPDRPIITGRVYNGERTPLWHSNGLLSGFHTQNYRGGGHNELVFDDATAQSRIRLGTSQQSTELNLGYLIHQQGNGRGKFRGLGFELRSDAYGAIRANQGLYLSSWGQPQGNGEQLDTDPARQQLSSAQQLHRQLSDLAAQHQAEPLTSMTPLQQAASDARVALPGHGAGSGGTSAAQQASNEGGQGASLKMAAPWLHVASPAGISLTTPESTHLAQGKHLSLTSGEDTTIATGKSLLATITQKLSLFVHNAGIKLFAAKGKVELQAQSDEMSLRAQKDVTLSSTGGKVDIAAADEILLSSGGAYVRIKGGNIEIHAPGTVDIKGAQHLFSGPASRNRPLPAMPNSQPANLELWHTYAQGEAVPGAKYRALLSDGQIKEGVLDAAGKASLNGVPPGGAQVEFFREPKPITGEGNLWPRWQGKGQKFSTSMIDTTTKPSS